VLSRPQQESAASTYGKCLTLRLTPELRVVLTI
jgi:hypothetical protein